MAGYSIVLNLSGNAVSQSERLADTLNRAAMSATKLATALGSVSAASRSIPTNNLRGYAPLNTGIRNTQTQAMNVAATKMQVAATKMQVAANSQNTAASRQNVAATKQNTAARNYTRHRAKRIGSFGTGIAFGGFSARLSSIFQPDENGNLLGINAGTLAKSINFTAIATNLFTSIGKSMLKLTAYSTAIPMIAAGGFMATAIRALQSEGFAEGVRLISRRHQAKQGLGAEYEQAQLNADFLAKGYGLDRSTALSSINVLTGLGVGGNLNSRLTLGEATSLTKVGGVISQHHGVPFERVMTNLQQLLVQQTPNLRDIRELLNQAPILQKYALKDMEQKGVKDVDVRTYLKDQNNILSALKRYELDTVSNSGMQARGEIALAMQDFWAKIAGNNKAWDYVGYQGSNLIGGISTGISSLLTILTDNPQMQKWVKNLEITFRDIGDKSENLIDKLIRIADYALEKFGIDVGNEDEAKAEIVRDKAIRAYFNQDDVKARAKEEWVKVGNNSKLEGKTAEDAFNSWYGNVIRGALKDQSLRNYVSGFGTIEPHMGKSTIEFMRGYTLQQFASEARQGSAPFSVYIPEIPTYKKGKTNFFGKSIAGQPDYGQYASTNQYAGYRIYNEKIDDFIQRYIAQQSSTSSDYKKIPTNGEDGSNLTGFNRDRKALTINFNAPIVEWTSTIEASNPQETVDVVAQNIEQMASAAIQKALLGATNKMSSRWY